jgi:hypothetical protein
MTDRALTAEQLAAWFDRSKPWLYENWQRLVAEGKLPPPLLEAGHLVWSEAQVSAYLDRPLPKDIRPLAAAHRAAFEAAAAAPKDHSEAERIQRDRETLSRRRMGDLR